MSDPSTDITMVVPKPVRGAGTGAPSRRSAFRIFAVLAGVAALVLLGRNVGGSVPEFARWVDSLGAWGPLGFILGYVIACVAFVPGSLLTLAAGAIFGVLPGILYVFIGATLGASAAFLLARYGARSLVERKLEGNQRFAAVDRAIAREGRKIVLLLRLSPVFPFNLLNYALGLTRVRFRDYVIAMVGILPGTVLYVYTGKLAGDVAALAGGAAVPRGAGYYAVLALGLGATILVTTIVTRIARRALQQATDGDEPLAR